MTQVPQQNPYTAPPTLPGSSYLYDGPTGSFPLASRADRFVGAFIDGVIVGIPTLIVGVALGIGLVLFVDPDSVMFQVAASVLGLVLGMGVFVAIQGYLLAHYGQTIGKRIVKTQILTDDDKLLPLGRMLLLRYLPLWLLSSIPYNIGFVFPIINALAIFRSSRKCIHDDIAGTKVVKIV
jgi:uncharacterized RDD family membrane protein YckC